MWLDLAMPSINARTIRYNISFSNQLVPQVRLEPIRFQPPSSHPVTLLHAQLSHHPV